jgi:integrase
LMVTGAGSRSWYYVYKPAGSRMPVQFYLGDANAPEMGLAQARVAAREQRLLRDQGRDPRDERRLAEAERRQQAAEAAKLEKETLAAAVDAYIEANGREWSPVTVHERERMARAYLPKMPSCNHPVTEVRPFEVEDDLKRLKPVQANRVRSLLLAASRWAVRKERISRDVMTATDRPTRQERSRDHTLQDDVIRALWRGLPMDAPPEATAALPPPIHAYLKLLLLCGTRRGETAAADWQDLDLDARLWTVPEEARKNRKPLDVPLSEAAVAVFRTLGQRERGRVFPPVIAACPGRVMARTRRSLKIKKGSEHDFKLHDLRRTYATGLQQLGVALPVITAALGQTPPRAVGVADATAAYTRHDYYPERQAAAEAWARRVAAIVAGKVTSSTVVPIDRGRRKAAKPA